MIEVTGEDPKPPISRWFKLRLKVATKLICAAKWIYPEHPEVNRFFMKSMMDYMVYSRSITKIDIKDYCKEVNDNGV